MADFLRMSEATALALHAMVSVAGQTDPMSAASIASELSASEAHLFKVLQQLVRSGLLQSKRGPYGGYVLARSAGSITLLDVYEVFEGPMRRDGCLFSQPVCGELNCILGTLVEDVRAQVVEHFSSTTLEQARRR